VCGCTDLTPCNIYTIAVAFDGDAKFRESFCGWIKRDLCSGCVAGVSFFPQKKI
jgi:hypothetical protein